MTMHLTPKKFNEFIDHINERLSQNYFGWYFDFDNEFNSYFLSIFNPNNFSEELIFLVSFDENTGITKGYRFKGNGKVIKINTGNVYLEQAKEVFNFLMEEGLATETMTMQ